MTGISTTSCQVEMRLVRLGLFRSLNFGAKESAVIMGRLLMVFTCYWENEAVYVETSSLFEQLISI